MNAQISMDTGIGGNGTFSLPQPSGAVGQITNGIAIVDAADVRIAINKLGWTVKQGQRWPEAEMVRMLPPLSGQVQTGIEPIFLPGGMQPGPVICGVWQIPITAVNWAKGQGWMEVAQINMLTNGSLPSPAIDYPGGNGIFSAQIAGLSGPAVIGLYVLAADGVTWVSTGVNVTLPNATTATSGWAIFDDTGPCKLRAQVISGTPSGVSTLVIPGTFRAVS